mmetsp:Transcript_16801/g.53198  ORF Transcript_16801/g.53198 Transcript_16801/m.53198 type:complete len:245 (+) Transcript_16801:175-909(+)
MSSLQARVVRPTAPAFVVHEVELRIAFAPAVVAHDALLAGRALLRELLGREERVEHTEVHRHVAQALGAHRAGVVALGVRLEAMRVHQVAAGQGPDRGRRREHVLAADRAVALEALLETAVVLEVHAHAGVARHAVKEVDTQALAAAAEVAERAVVDVPPRGVVEQLADGAEVARHLLPAPRAVLAHRLPQPALHAHHLLALEAVHVVVCLTVVAETACGRPAAALCHKQGLPLVVLASHHPLI